MNTAVRALQHSHVSIVNIISLKNMLILSLVFTVLISALSVVYTKDLNRRLFNDLQTTQKIRDDLYIEWGQLLLEQSAWSTQSRVQQLANEQLQMEVVISKEIKLVRP